MKARKVKGLDPAGFLADNMERIVRVRLGELCDFMPRAGRVGEVEALHDMRIAAKRLRYILEIAHPCFGEYARTSVRQVKELQDLLGEIHDCDVQVEEVQDLLDRLAADDAHTLAAAATRRDDLDPRALRRAPHRRTYSGLTALVVYLRARRELLFARFSDMWQDVERKGFRARLEYAVSERATPRPEPTPEPVAVPPDVPASPFGADIVALEPAAADGQAEADIDHAAPVANA